MGKKVIKVKSRLISSWIITLLILMGFPYLFELGSINTNVQATSWTVNDDGGADFSSIQAAIDSVSNSDTIFVWEGTYYEHLVVNKKLKIIGNGTENTTINGGGGDTLIEITIDGTEIYNLNLTNCWRGIYLNSVSNCKIFDNRFQNCSYGIQLASAQNNNITNNTGLYCDYGISLTSSSFNKIIKNTINSMMYYSFYLWSSSENNYFFNNICEFCGSHPLYLDTSSNNNFINNTFKMDDINYLYLRYSSNLKFIKNTMISCGIFINGLLDNWVSNIIDKNNTVDGKPIYYIKNANGGTITSDVGQIILANCTGMIIKNQNLSSSGVGLQLGYTTDSIIENNSYYSNQYGIYLAFSTGNIIRNNSCQYNSVGISIVFQSSNNEIHNNSCVNNVYFGIEIYQNSNNIVENNNFSNNRDGIYGYSSYLNIFANNTCYFNDQNGIKLRESNDNILKNNNCNFNNGTGIQLFDSSSRNILINNSCNFNKKGIYVYGCSLEGNTIDNNNCSGNIFEGICNEYSIASKISNNTCQNNDLGIYFEYFWNAILVNNTCINNFRGIWVRYSSNNKFENCLVESNMNSDFILRDDSYNNVAINTTFDKVSILDDSSFIVKNYLNLQVNDSNNLPVDNVDVRIKDNNQTIYATQGYGGSQTKTNYLGRIDKVLVTDRVYNRSMVATGNVTKVNIKKSGLIFRNNSRNVTMSRSHFEYFKANGVSLKIDLLSPTDNLYTNDSTPELKWNYADDPENDSLTYQIQVDEIGGDWSYLVFGLQILENLLSVNITPKLPDGSYQWRVRAFDGFENNSWSDIWIFTVDTGIPIAKKPFASGKFNNTGSVNWTWEPSIDTGSGIVGYFVCIGTFEGGNDIVNQAWTQNTSFTLDGLLDGISYYCKIRAQNGAGTIGKFSESSEGITVDLSPPINLSISINNGDGFTDLETITLKLTAVDTISGPAKMRFSTDNINWDDWGNFSDIKSYIIPSGDGLKTVYFEVQDLAGNIGPSVSDSIVLDTMPPHSLKITINNGALQTNTTNVTLTLVGYDNGSGPAQMQFSADGAHWDEWEPYSTSKFYSLSHGDGLKSIYFKVKDLLDNIAAPVSDTIILNTTKPPIDTDRDGIPDYIDADDDNDLIPDEWEEQYGFNKTDPNDVDIDTDEDKLNNLGEYLNNTNPRNPDTDGDGLLDGDEVLVYFTDPINPDTDGDGFDDGYEVAVETDPLDENDYPVPKKEKSKDVDYFVYILIIVIITIISGIVLFLKLYSTPKPVKKDIREKKDVEREDLEE